MTVALTPTPTDITRFYRHNEMTDILQGLAAGFPTLCSIESMGQSYEGRDLWVLTITNTATGPADEKPAMYIDGNIHAGELTGCNVALSTAERLLFGYGSDEEITHLLDTSAVYIAPRVQPDGAEKYMTTPYTLRSSVRHWPETEQDSGLTPQDLNDDGLILQMRVPDPRGEWRISAHDPRLMVKRAPDEMTAEGGFFRLYTEGLLHEWTRGPVKLARTLEGLDLNRNWPANWSPLQRGGGPFPLSEPETRAVAAFISAHPNISIAQNYHTTGGVILRAPCAVGDNAVPPRDKDLYSAVGDLGEAITGYPCSSVHDSFQEVDDAGRRSQSGGFIEWTYDHLGILSFATELWDIQSRAGIERPKNDPMRTMRVQTEEDGLKLLAFNDEQLGGRGFVAWAPFEHPQLGAVEIGGWKSKEVRQNAPAEFLEDECERNSAYSIRQGLMLPRLVIDSVETEAVSDDLHIVRAHVSNHGYLSTSATDQAQRVNAVTPVTVEIEGAGEVLLGQRRQSLGQLQGRFSARGMMFAYGMAKVDNERMVEWLVRGTGNVTIVARGQRSGVARCEVAL